MKTYFNARIEWIDYSAGGRKVTPSLGARYCPIIRISDNEHWSIYCICPDFDTTDHIEFTMFSDAAPSEKILENKYYGLFEGNRKVAEVFIISKDKREM